ncbi:MAG: ferritin-like domain-containing protein [Thainema sp.]
MHPYPTAGFHLPHAAANDKLHRILSAALPSSSQVTINLTAPAWNAQHFNLDRVQIFQKATDEEQQQIVAIANRALLEEAYFIEQAGVGYMAKMVLMAETQEERMLYGLFAADETQHLAQIRQFLPDAPQATRDPFLQLLAELVESDDRAVMLFVLQVVLEGWGLSHYRSLASDCQQPILQQCLKGFIDAESRHHGAGLTLFLRSHLSPSQQNLIQNILRQFLQMIQVGPQRVLSAIAQVKGHLSQPQKIQILTELDTLTHSGTRLKTLHHLMQSPQTHSLVAVLEQDGYFQPLPAELCATV